MKSGRIVALVFSPILGCLLGFGLAYATEAGWLSNSWESIGAPPSKPANLLAISQGEVWLTTQSGGLYHWPTSYDCAQRCWEQVPQLPPTPTPELYVHSIGDEPCTSPPPLSAKVQTLSQCIQLDWDSVTTTFAITRDGEVFRWRANVLGEGSVLAYFTLPFIGALALFLPVLAWALFVRLLDGLARRAQSRGGKEPPAQSPG